MRPADARRGSRNELGLSYSPITEWSEMMPQGAVTE